MKKMMVILLFMLVAVGMMSSQAFAVAGVCSNCHTMHNSQNGTAMNFNGSPTPNPILLRGDCLGCHAVDPAAGADNGPSGGNVIAPQVAHAFATELAGGNFSNTVADETYGHNVTTLNLADSLLANTPPGGASLASQLTCAGTLGCHGDRTVANEMASLQGGHHSNTNGQLNGATTVGNSYRFLKGAKGTEDNDWQNTSGAADHNEYFSDNPDAAGFGVSKICASCHTNFHTTANTQSGGEWVRHPVEVAIGAAYATNYGATYDVTVPVGRVAVAAISGVVAATDTVVCMSCHKAHAGDYADALRWDYSTIVAGTGGTTGCNKCHAK